MAVRYHLKVIPLNIFLTLCSIRNSSDETLGDSIESVLLEQSLAFLCSALCCYEVKWQSLFQLEVNLVRNFVIPI